MSKHTPGPWVADGAQIFKSNTEGDTNIAQANGFRFDRETVEANARLLAAAPELLELLISARRLGLNFDIGTAYIRRSYIDKQDELNAQIDALISKIGGAA